LASAENKVIKSGRWKQKKTSRWKTGGFGKKLQILLLEDTENEEEFN